MRIRTEAEQFLFWEYINGLFVAVQSESAQQKLELSRQYMMLTESWRVTWQQGAVRLHLSQSAGDGGGKLSWGADGLLDGAKGGGRVLKTIGVAPDHEEGGPVVG